MKSNKFVIILLLLIILPKLFADNILNLFPNDAHLGQAAPSITQKDGVVRLLPHDSGNSEQENVLLKYVERIDQNESATYYIKNEVLRGISVSSPWDEDTSRFNSIRIQLKSKCEYLDYFETVRATSFATTHPVRVERWKIHDQDNIVLLVATSEELTVTTFDPSFLDVNDFFLMDKGHHRLEATLEKLKQKIQTVEESNFKFVVSLKDTPDISSISTAGADNEQKDNILGDNAEANGVITDYSEDSQSPQATNHIKLESSYFRIITIAIVVFTALLFTTVFLIRKRKMPFLVIVLMVVFMLFMVLIILFDNYKDGRTIFQSQSPHGLSVIRVREIPSIPNALWIFSPVKEKFYAIEYGKSITGMPLGTRLFSMDSYTVNSIDVEWEKNDYAHVYFDGELVMVLDAEWWRPTLSTEK
jgi:hypothetical protein